MLDNATFRTCAFGCNIAIFFFVSVHGLLPSSICDASLSLRSPSVMSPLLRPQHPRGCSRTWPPSQMPALRRQNYPSQKQLQSGSRHWPSRSCGHWITCQTDAQVRVRIFIMCHIGKRGARSGQEATKHCPIPIILFHVIRYVRAVKATVNFLGPSFIPVLGDVLSEKLGYFLGIFIVPFAFYHLEEEQSC